MVGKSQSDVLRLADSISLIRLYQSCIDVSASPHPLSATQLLDLLPNWPEDWIVTSSLGWAFPSLVTKADRSAETEAGHNIQVITVRLASLKMIIATGSHHSSIVST